ncbi:MAG: LysR family transcriptional regulator [Candidatus Delongbacteria bacterium]|nr:LysR family transcriptional regulator [Candidatus Delongbacteria bacterium]
MSLNPAHLSLTELRYFVVLAEVGHFGRAAEACHVSQPTLSAGIRKLEQTLGLVLFERGNRLLGITAEGRSLLPRARRVLEEAGELVEAATVAGEGLSGSLRLGVIPTVAPDLLPWLVPLWARKAPALNLVWHEDRTASLLAALHEFRLDAALLALPVELDGLEADALYTEEFLLALPSGQTDPSGPVDPATLSAASLLLLTEGHCLRDQALEICGSTGRSGEGPASDFQATSLDTLIQLVSTGYGMTLLPRLSAERSPGLCLRHFVAPAPTRTIALIWRRTTPRAPEFRRLAGLLKQSLPDHLSAAGTQGVSAD